MEEKEEIILDIWSRNDSVLYSCSAMDVIRSCVRSRPRFMAASRVVIPSLGTPQLCMKAKVEGRWVATMVLSSS